MRTLWVDSICINQGDDNERSQQVRLMGQIYRKASTVLIWLGEELDEGKTKKAYHCMSLLEQAMPKLTDPYNNGIPKEKTNFVGLTRPMPGTVHRDLGIPFLGSPEFDALIDLLKNPWFFRAWTWQESFLAKESRFFRGSSSWPGEGMRQIGSALCNLSSAYGSNNEFVAGYLNASLMTTSLDFLTRNAYTTNMRLFALLILRRGAGCTLPSDLVYSLLGAASESIDIEIDYQQPFEMVFAKSAWKITIQEGTDLSILSQVERDRQLSTLPTWVPDWRMNGINIEKTSAGLGPSHQYAATGSSRPAGSLSDDAKVLTLVGLNWDRIRCAKNALYPKRDEWVDGFFTTVVDGKKFYTPTNESLERALRRVCYLDQTRYTTEHEPTRWNSTSHEEFEDIEQGALSGGQDGILKYQTLRASFTILATHQSIIISNDGRLGIASDAVLPGDVITMLLGGEFPVVLRPLENEPGHYTFVCVCYIHGFMDGQSLVDARRSAQPEHDPSDKSWLHNLHTTDIPFPVEKFHLH